MTAMRVFYPVPLEEKIRKAGKFVSIWEGNVGAPSLVRNRFRGSGGRCDADCWMARIVLLTKKYINYGNMLCVGEKINKEI